MNTHVSKEQLAEKAKIAYEDIKQKYAVTPITTRERLAIPPEDMPTGDPKIRARRIEEVALGYTQEQAIVEATRCLQCKNEPCVQGCPVNIAIPQFIAKITAGNFKAAVDTIKRTNLLPAVCGRVCPQEKQCQSVCTVGKIHKSVDKAVSIGRLERFVADWEREHNEITVPEVAPATGKKVAVIGSGPAGLTVAADCRRAGHDVTVFEAMHKAGGVMLYGIPEFRLPKEILTTEIANLKKMGVRFELNALIGRTTTLEQLLNEKGYNAAFIGTGAGLPKFLGIPGENYIGVFSAN